MLLTRSGGHSDKTIYANGAFSGSEVGRQVRAAGPLRGADDSPCIDHRLRVGHQNDADIDEYSNPVDDSHNLTAHFINDPADNVDAVFVCLRHPGGIRSELLRRAGPEPSSRAQLQREPYREL